MVLQADPWTGPGATPRDLIKGIKGSVPPIYTKGATLNYFYSLERGSTGRGFLGAWAGAASAGPVLRSQGGSGEEVAFALRLVAGSVPPIYTKGATLNCFYSLETGSTGRGFLGAWAGGGSAGPVLRSQGGSGEEVAFALRARGLGDRLQCSLRPGPADNFGVRNRIVTQRSIRS